MPSTRFDSSAGSRRKRPISPERLSERAGFVDNGPEPGQVFDDRVWVNRPGLAENGLELGQGLNDRAYGRLRPRFFASGLLPRLEELEQLGRGADLLVGSLKSRGGPPSSARPSLSASLVRRRESDRCSSF